MLVKPYSRQAGFAVEAKTAASDAMFPSAPAPYRGLSRDWTL
jgi:hypothetical protein